MKNNIVSLSGGKNSTAMLLQMIELGYKITDIVFADTKLEFPEIYNHLNKLNKYCIEKIGIKITIIKTKYNFEDWFYGKWTSGQSKGEIRGFPRVKDPCYWSRESKYKILNNFCKGHRRYIGIAADESNRKQNKKDYEYPLIKWQWTEKKCRDYLQQYPKFYPSILRKFPRTGCWLCPKQSIKSLEILYNYYPRLWKKLKKYERDSPHNLRSNKSLNEYEKKFKANKDQTKLL